MRRLANGMAQRGVRVEMMVAESACRPDWLEGIDPRIVVTPLRRLRRADLWLTLVWRLVRNGPSVLLAFDQRAALLAARTMAVPGVRTRLWISPKNAIAAQMNGWSPARTARRVQQLRRVHARTAGVIAVSQGLAHDYATTLGIELDNIFAVYNPIVDDTLHTQATASVELPWPTEPMVPLILSIGRLAREKDYPTLLRAFALLRNSRQARLLILGEGEERAALTQLAADLNIASDCAMPGFVPNPYAYLARANLFALTSLWEGFGNVLAEALALGIPAVSTDCPSGPAEILAGGRYGPLVPVGDANAVAGAMAAVLDSPPSAAHQRNGAERFKTSLIVDRYLELMGLSGAGAPDEKPPPHRKTAQS
ncbi:Glycosyl transferase group 1 [Nitrococcus mobilis Nb-231]|uniref:Glycosyl transferase group 1 n=2 Tax=Nitrococcus mobilis TaxID=35797 RepID=A4BMB9_9GAMM|nr:Glycosyl transferase group 1 [Nitrococcus mobilis Nb-231]